MVALSILMPTYNGGKYLAEQIDSIRAQSDGDFRLLIADDGSTDETVSIIDSFVARDRRIERLSAFGNVGQKRRIAMMASAVSTEFLAIADQDDIWEPDRNARLLAAIGNRAIAFGRSQLIGKDGGDLGLSILDAMKIRPWTVGPLKSLFHPLVSAHGAIVRADWFDVGPLYGSLPFDQIQGTEALFSRGLVYVEDAVVFHRIHGENQMNGEVLRPIGHARVFSRYRARLAMTFVRTERLRLYLMFDQLGRSFVLSAAVRRMFQRLAEACRTAWYCEWDRFSHSRRALEALLTGTLCPYAESPEDLTYFTQRIASVTRSQFTPTNFRIGCEIYRDRPVNWESAHRTHAGSR